MKKAIDAYKEDMKIAYATMVKAAKNPPEHLKEYLVLAEEAGMDINLSEIGLKETDSVKINDLHQYYTSLGYKVSRSHSSYWPNEFMYLEINKELMRDFVTFGVEYV